MATRFYLSETAFTIVNPGTLGSWGATSLKSIKKMLTTNPSDTSSITFNVEMTGAFTSLHRQYVSEPMAAGIVFNSSTTYTLCMRYSESSTAANIFGLFYVAIVSEDGTTVRASFSSSEKEGTEHSTTLTARSNTATGKGISYTTVAGDRLVLESGVDKDASGTYTTSYNYLNTSGTDLSGEGDTNSRNYWFETSNNITFGSEGSPPSSNEDFEISTYISGVCDEWV